MKPRDLLDRIRRPFSSAASRRADAGSRREEEDLEAIAAREQRAFRYEALAAATRNFGAKQKLGEGGFGPVYRGRLDDGREVAVKRLGAGSRQGAREFRNEATLLSRVQHRNVVNLLGYCAHGADQKLLVYEYVPNESLDKILFSNAPPRHPNKSHYGKSITGATPMLMPTGVGLFGSTEFQRAASVPASSVNAKPTTEEVIAFGGIAPPSVNVRASPRIGKQMDADATQMERAMRIAKMRNESSCSGYSYDGSLGPTVGSPLATGAAGCHGFWMHTAPDGRSGYLVPGWLAAF